MRKSFRDMTAAERKAKREYDAAYYAANREAANVYEKARRAALSDKINAYKVAYHAAHPEKKKAYRDAHRQERNAHVRKRRTTDHQFRLGLLLRTRIWSGLNGLGRAAPTEKLLGCTLAKFAILWPELIKRYGLENVPPDQIHIDHFIPCASYDLTDPEQQHLCFHWSNLRPMRAVDNVRKGARHPTEAEIAEHILLRPLTMEKIEQ